MDRNHRRTFAVGNERFAQLGSIGELVFHQSLMILLPYNASRSEVRPERFERRARLVSAIARGRQWLDDVVSGRVTTVAELCAREKCSVQLRKPL